MIRVYGQSRLEVFQHRHPVGWGESPSSPKMQFGVLRIFLKSHLKGTPRQGKITFLQGQFTNSKRHPQVIGVPFPSSRIKVVQNQFRLTAQLESSSPQGH